MDNEPLAATIAVCFGTVMLVHPLTNNSGGVIASCPSGIGGYTVPVVAGQPTYDQPAIRVGLGSDYY